MERDRFNRIKQETLRAVNSRKASVFTLGVGISMFALNVIIGGSNFNKGVYILVIGLSIINIGIRGRGKNKNAK